MNTSKPLTISPALAPTQRIPLWQMLDPGLLVVLAVFVLLLPLSTPRIYATDEVQYYAYLHSLYFDNDLDFANEYRHFADVGIRNGDQAVYNALLRDRSDDPPLNPATGKYRNLAPIGSAILWSPGFALADVGVRLARMGGVDVAADGYSAPYIWAVCFMSALYALLGLLLCYQMARRFVGVFAATLATVGVWLASPLVFYTYIAMPWSHATAFFLVALFLALWLRDVNGTLLEQRALRPWWRWALLGIVGGLMVSTREQMGLFLLLPAVEGGIAYVNVLRRSGVGRRPARADTRYALPLRHLLIGHVIFGVCFVLALLPQLATYYVLNGRPMPANVVTGKLSSSGGISPHFFDTLIHPAHGAFFWSPIIAIGLVGLLWVARRDWLLAALLLLGFVAQTYLNGSFGTTWHLSRAFGYRRLIECTPIFIIGLALLFEHGRSRLGHAPLVLLVALLVYWNAGLVVQWAIVRPEMRAGLIWDGMVYYQFVEVPGRLVGTLNDLLFHRCRFLKNQQC